MSIDWNVVKIDYMTGGMSYRALGRKYGISNSNISRRGRREGWPALREKFEEEYAARSAKLAAEKKVERLTAYAGRMNDKMLRLYSRVLEKIDETLACDEPFSPRDLKYFSSLLLNMWQGLDAVNPQERDYYTKEVMVKFVNGPWKKKQDSGEAELDDEEIE